MEIQVVRRWENVLFCGIDQSIEGSDKVVDVELQYNHETGQYTICTPGEEMVSFNKDHFEVSKRKMQVLEKVMQWIEEQYYVINEKSEEKDEEKCKILDTIEMPSPNYPLVNERSITQNRMILRNLLWNSTDGGQLIIERAVDALEEKMYSDELGELENITRLSSRKGPSTRGQMLEDLTIAIENRKIILRNALNLTQ
jgi:hypothetical protein